MRQHLPRKKMVFISVIIHKVNELPEYILEMFKNYTYRQRADHLHTVANLVGSYFCNALGRICLSEWSYSYLIGPGSFQVTRNGN